MVVRFLVEVGAVGRGMGGRRLVGGRWDVVLGVGLLVAGVGAFWVRLGEDVVQLVGVVRGGVVEVGGAMAQLVSAAAASQNLASGGPRRRLKP